MPSATEHYGVKDPDGKEYEDVCERKSIDNRDVD